MNDSYLEAAQILLKQIELNPSNIVRIKVKKEITN